MARKLDKRTFTPKGGAKGLHGPGAKRPKFPVKSGTKKINQKIKPPSNAMESY